ncbi:MAG: 30S ribosomal protein S8 [Parcubacteria group bacterium]|nr:30S ribosomal protein S8 [Parcubacteria group bacterium]MBI3074772.1 30S ribosomal protein S8 [Parcubacteria group bacterium]
MDPIADTLIQIKNAGTASRETVSAPYSKFRHAVLEALLKAGYIASLEKKARKQKKILEIGVLYRNGHPRIEGVKKVSKSSRRIYTGVKKTWRVRQGFGDLFLSTPAGVLTAKEAKKKRVGGEVLFEIW